MQRETKAIGFACFVGMFLGSVAAFECSRRFGFAWAWSWLVGLAVGGTLGYICQDVRGFGAGVARAWRAVSGWQPDGEWWQTRAQFVSAHTFMGGLTGFYLGLALFLVRDPERSAAMPLMEFVMLRMLAFGVIGTLASLLRSLLCDRDCCIIDRENASGAWKVVKYLSPPFALFWIVYGAFHLAAWALPRTPAFFRFLRRFLWIVVLYVHSAKRTLCLVDSCIGVTITFFTNGSPFVYALVGALCGMVQWELISVRVLHVPQST